MVGIHRSAAIKGIRGDARLDAAGVRRPRCTLIDRHEAGPPHTLYNQLFEHGWLCTLPAGLAEDPATRPCLSTTEAAAIPGVHPDTIVQRCNQGRYPAAR